jgi:hypothetical protein
MINIAKKPDAKKATTDAGKKRDMQKRILKKRKPHLRNKMTAALRFTIYK